MKGDSEDQGADKFFTFPSRGRAVSMGTASNIKTATLGKRGWQERLEAGADNSEQNWQDSEKVQSTFPSWSPAEGCIWASSWQHHLQELQQSYPSPDLSAVLTVMVWGASPRILKIFSLHLPSTSEKCRTHSLGDEGVQWHQTSVHWILQSPEAATCINAVLLLTQRLL